jgi:hypothetical protein
MKLTLASLTALCFLLVGCASDGGKADFLKAEAGYTAVLQLAANYVALPRCESANAPKLCSKQAVVDQIRPAANSADATVQAAEDLAMNGNANDTAFSTALQAASAASASLSAILAQYGVK